MVLGNDTGFGQREPRLPLGESPGAQGAAPQSPLPSARRAPGLWWVTALQAAPAPCARGAMERAKRWAQGARSSGAVSALTARPRVGGQLGTGRGLSSLMLPQSLSPHSLALLF